MTVYEAYKTIHVISAVLWLGGGAMIYILASKMRKASDTMSLISLGQTGEKLGKVFFMPLAIVQLLSGILLVLEGDWGFERLWVVIGIAGIVASSILGAVFLGPEGGKLAVTIQEKGIDHQEVQSGLSRILTLNRVDVAILFFVLAMMVIKPGS